MYVDDVLVTASTEVIHAVMEAFKAEWECKIVGVIPKDETLSEYKVTMLVCMPISIEPIDGGLQLHQHENMRGIIIARLILHTRSNLPDIKEGRDEPMSKEMRESKAFNQTLKEVQREVGSLQWPCP